MKTFILQHRNIFKTFVVCISIAYISACNFSYEDTPDNLPSGLHPSEVPFNRVYHGKFFRFPYGNCDEPQCHGLNLKGGNSGGPSCYSCHTDKWSIFSISHTIKVAGYYHHYNVDSGDFIANCGQATCHGSTLEGVQDQGYSCYACHDPIPAPGHRVSKDGVMHHLDIGKNPAVYCYKSGCHGSGEPGGMCNKSGCHGSAYPSED